MKNLTESQIIDIAAEIAAYHMKGSIYDKRSFLRLRYKPLLSITNDYRKCSEILNKILNRIHVEMNIPELKIRTGYSLGDLCNDVMGIFAMRHITNETCKVDDHIGYFDGIDEIDFSHESDRTEVLTDDDMIDVQIFIALLDTTDLSQYNK